MNWRFVGYAAAGYATAWLMVGYLAVITLIGGPLDVPSLIQGALLFTPFGAAFGAIAADMHR